MNENLFKLKKDGKTVGYLRISNKIWWKTNHSRSWVEIDPQEGCSDFFEDDNGWDTAHPFVTKDKNGKDVFADDCCYSGNAEGYIRWSDTELAWNFEWDDYKGDTHSVSMSRVSAIELIEDKEDE